MTEQFRDSDSPQGAGSRFRNKAELDEAFGAIARQLGEELSVDESEKKDTNDNDIEQVLNTIDRLGIRQFVKSALSLIEFDNGESEPATSSQVINYLDNVRTRPPIKITDIGSIDEELIEQLNLRKSSYIDDLQYLLTFIDPEVTEISVLDLPKLRQQMLEYHQERNERVLTNSLLNTHGISVVFDNNDAKAWADLKSLIQDISDNEQREYSRHLRRKKKEGTWTPIRDVADYIDERLMIRNEAAELARSYASKSQVERDRLLDGLRPHLRNLVRSFFEDIDAAFPKEDQL